MSRFLLKVSILLIIVFTAFSFAARALGATQPPNPALAGFSAGCEGEPQPCWYGIVLEVTHSLDATDKLSQLGYKVDLESGTTRRMQAKPMNHLPCGSLYADVDLRTNVLVDFGFDLCEKIALGDFMAAFGIPDVRDVGYRHCSIQLIFPSHHLEVTLNHSTQLSQPISNFQLTSGDGSDSSGLSFHGKVDWYGTLPLWRYRAQLSDNFTCR
jgi:hypothetical protein